MSVKEIYMSGDSDEAFSCQGILEQGAVLIQKPFSPGDLLYGVREALDVTQQYDLSKT